jgi:hypothetical protein
MIFCYLVLEIKHHYCSYNFAQFRADSLFAPAVDEKENLLERKFFVGMERTRSLVPT